MPPRATALTLIGLLCACPGSGDPVDGGPAEAAPDGGLAFSDGPSAADAPTADADAAPAVSYTYDVDGDNNNDTNLALAACTAAPTRRCLHVSSTLLSDRQIDLGADVKGAAASPVLGAPITVIGNHLGQALHEVAVLYVRISGGGALAVVDLQAAKVAASTGAPAGQSASFSDFPRGPQGRRYPFLAPSYGDTPGAKLWGYLCLFSYGAAGGGGCGAHFVKASTVPTCNPWSDKSYFFREVGGYLQDIDGDGWDEIHLIYHATVLAISAKTGQAVACSSYDVAAASEPSAPQWFHSGRNYGTHAALTSTDGTRRTLMVGGIPVGSFADVNCNVSRFVAVLASAAGQPATRKLAWSRYYGFASTTFSVIDAKYAANPPVARAADILDDCIHRFGDSLSVMDGAEVAIFNYFASDTPVDTCVKEQYQLYLPPTWTTAKSKAWYDCLDKNLAVTGVWGMQVLRLGDGLPLTGGQQSYVWGRTDRLLPGKEVLYLVQLLPSKTKYDLSQEPASKLQARALVKGLWTTRGTFPKAGRPQLTLRAAAGSRGVGSYTSFAELTVKDLDSDGLDEVQLSDGSWVGYDAASKALKVKTP